MSTGQRASEQIVEAVTSWPGVALSRQSRPGGARRIEIERDVLDVIALLRLNYEQLVARGSVPVDAAA
ncbi:MAG TPA: hypothetical protein VHH57_03980 [Gaiella sp.]|jgi:hypothetical protein|nr:hypothetical protein [Gaiella sp.]